MEDFERLGVMGKYVALLRGINVSGQKKILMADLRGYFEELGFDGVGSYIQSGNVVFESKIKSVSVLEKKIGSLILEKYGFDVPVVVRTGAEMLGVAGGCPFGDVDLKKEGSRVMVTFLDREVGGDVVEELMVFVKEPERLEVVGKHVYLYCPGGYGKTKLTHVFLEKKLGVAGTTRNWNGVLKLTEMLLG